MFAGTSFAIKCVSGKLQGVVFISVTVEKCSCSEMCLTILKETDANKLEVDQITRDSLLVTIQP